MTLARIRSIVGEDAVGRPLLHDSHRIDAFQLDCFQVSHERFDEITPAPAKLGVRQVRPHEFIEVGLSHRTPYRFTFRNISYIVEHAYGPWLKSGDWWNSLTWSVEQWDIAASSKTGARLYCSLVHHPDLNRWLISSLYD